MTIKVGDKLPGPGFCATAGRPAVKTTDVFKGKKVALFAVPAPMPAPATMHMPSIFLNAYATRTRASTPLPSYR
jgi:peroxiredoxin